MMLADAVLALRNSGEFRYFAGPPLRTSPRKRTAPSTKPPPTRLHGPGRSPFARSTQSGFKIGSSIGTKIASRAVTWRMARL